MGAIVAAGLVLAGVGAVFAGLLWPRRENVIETRLSTFAVRPRTLEEIELAQPFSERVTKPIMHSVSRIVLSRTPSATLERLRHDLVVAGHPNNISAEDFLGIRGLSGIGVSLLGFFLMILIGKGIVWAIIAAVVMGFVGFLLPNYWLQSKITARRKEVVQALPDCLDLLSITVEAGLGFDSAVHKLTDKWDNSLTREFDRYLAEMRMGKSRRDALRDLSARLDVPDVSAFIAAIVQADQLGASISRTLQIQSDQMRMKRRQRAEKLAHEAPIKMLIPMALFMLPTIYIVIFGPMVPKLAAMLGAK